MERRETFALAREAPARARGVIGEELASLSAQVREDATLLMSELITNAVCHARERDPAEVELRVRTDPGTVRVVVTDPGTGSVPAPKVSAGADGSGWGLYLLDRIADGGACSPTSTPRCGSRSTWTRPPADPVRGRAGADRRGPGRVRGPAAPRCSKEG
jgi:anti-sigma regulatory factor (Ser/Thr protein kinase)